MSPVPGFQFSTLTRKRHWPTLSRAPRGGKLGLRLLGSFVPGKRLIAFGPRQTTPVLPLPSAQQTTATETVSDWPRVATRSPRLPYPKPGPHGLAFTSAALAAAVLLSCLELFPFANNAPSHSVIGPDSAEEGRERGHTAHRMHLGS